MFGNFFELKLNGIVASEAIFNAALTGHFNVPVIMVTGDQHVVSEAKEFFGSVEVVTTKESRGFFSAKSPHPNVICSEIKKKSKISVQRINEFKPFRLNTPITMEITYKHTAAAEAVSYLPWFKRKNGKTVSVEIRNMKEATGIIIGLGSINSL